MPAECDFKVDSDDMADGVNQCDRYCKPIVGKGADLRLFALKSLYYERLRLTLEASPTIVTRRISGRSDLWPDRHDLPKQHLAEGSAGTPRPLANVWIKNYDNR